jgi:hypothetical protein
MTLIQEEFWDLQANNFEFHIEPESEKFGSPLGSV